MRELALRLGWYLAVALILAFVPVILYSAVQEPFELWEDWDRSKSGWPPKPDRNAPTPTQAAAIRAYAYSAFPVGLACEILPLRHSAISFFSLVETGYVGRGSSWNCFGPTPPLLFEAFAFFKVAFPLWLIVAAFLGETSVRLKSRLARRLENGA